MTRLPVLLSRVLGGVTADVQQPDDPSRHVSSLAVWSNVLRCIAAGLPERDLPEAARISKRLAVAAVTGSKRHGWITAHEQTLRLADTGRFAADAWRARLEALDDQWAGSDLRDALEVLVGRLPWELPWFPASYGPADPSAIGGSFVARRGDTPAHGQDWHPVRRDDGNTVSDVPLTGLLSQALVAFAIDYEARPMWPLASTALVVRHLHAEPTPLDDVPGDHGITGNGKSLLERHGVATVTKDPSNPRRKLVGLTELGQNIARHHDQFVAECESSWRDRYGAEVVDRLRAALEAHPSAADTSLPDHVVAPLHLG